MSRRRFEFRLVDVLGVAEFGFAVAAGRTVRVVGANASGKTSTAVAVTALVCEDANPLGVPAAAAKGAYLRDGAVGDRHFATLTVADGGVDVGEVRWLPASQRIVSDVGGAVSSPQLCGLVDWTARGGDRGRAVALQQLLLPPLVELLGLVRERLGRHVPPDDLDGVLETVERRGWSAALSVFSDRARQAKRQWRQVTGETYGVRKAADWHPDGWLSDWDGLTPQQSDEMMVDARAALAVLQGTLAVSQADADRASRSAEELPAARQALADARAKAETVRVERDDLAALMSGLEAEQRQCAATRRRLEAAVARLGAGPPTCPHCDRPVAVADSGRLVKVDPTVRAEQKQAAELELADVNSRAGEVAGRLAGLADKLAVLGEAAVEVERLVVGERRKVAILESGAAMSGQVRTVEHDRDVAEAEQHVEDVRKVVDAVKAHAEAARLHETVDHYSRIAGALGPQGVRAKLIADGMARLNAGLVRLSDITGWPLVEVDAQGRVLLAGRPAVFGSESERWRAQATIQLTLAALSDGQVVVLDRADVLDEANQVALEVALRLVAERTGVAVVVCATEDVDRLTVAG